MAAVSRAKAGPKKDAVRAEVRALVHGPSYMTFDDAIAEFPMEHINTRPPNVPYTPWHLLEHMRIAQRDILDYIEDPLRDTGFLVEDAELGRQLALDVREHRERQILQLVLGRAPGVVHVLAVRGNTQQLRVTRLEFLVELAERGDLGRAHEREVLGPEEDYAPLSLVGLLVERLESLGLVVGHDAGQGVLGEFLSDT